MECGPPHAQSRRIAATLSGWLARPEPQAQERQHEQESVKTQCACDDNSGDRDKDSSNKHNRACRDKKPAVQCDGRYRAGYLHLRAKQSHPRRFTENQPDEAELSDCFRYEAQSQRAPERSRHL